MRSVLAFMFVFVGVSACSTIDRKPGIIDQAADPFLEIQNVRQDKVEGVLSLAYFDDNHRGYNVVTTGMTSVPIGRQDYGCNEHGCRRVENLRVSFSKGLFDQAMKNGLQLEMITDRGSLDRREISAFDVRYAFRRFENLSRRSSKF